MLGIKVKHPGPTLNRWEDFAGWINSVKNAGRDYQYHNKYIEGFVVEDASGYQFKIKLDFYSFWKYMRSHKDKIRRARLKEQTLPAPPDDREAARFHEWLICLSSADLEKKIITLRELFFKEMGREV